MTNTTPVAGNVSGSSFEDTFVSITLTSGGTGDASSEPPSFTFATQPAHGTLWIVPPIPGIDPRVPAMPGSITSCWFGARRVHAAENAHGRNKLTGLINSITIGR